MCSGRIISLVPRVALLCDQANECATKGMACRWNVQGCIISSVRTAPSSAAVCATKEMARRQSGQAVCIISLVPPHHLFGCGPPPAPPARGPTAARRMASAWPPGCCGGRRGRPKAVAEGGGRRRRSKGAVEGGFDVGGVPVVSSMEAAGGGRRWRQKAAADGGGHARSAHDSSGLKRLGCRPQTPPGRGCSARNGKTVCQSVEQNAVRPRVLLRQSAALPSFPSQR